MGLLDDAIREHLDLKRRRGADLSEVERDEREALGPVRRGPEDIAVDDGDVDDGDVDESEVEHGDELEHPEGDLEWDDAWDEEPEPAAHSPATDHGDVEAAPVPADPPDFAAPSPRSAPGPHEDAPFDHGEDTAEYDVEHELEKEKGDPERKQGEDVLEETPDFLQDAPEHDRLWFEQRPPRDFDFDG